MRWQNQRTRNLKTKTKKVMSFEVKSEECRSGDVVGEKTDERYLIRL